MAQRINSYAEYLDWDNSQARQELLSTMSSFSLGPSYSYSPEPPSYPLMDARPQFDWRAQQNFQGHASSSPMQVPQGFPAPQPGRVIRSPFTGNMLAGPVSASSWPSSTTAATATLATASTSSYDTGYFPVQQHASSSPSYYQQAPAYMSAPPVFGAPHAFPHGMPSSGMPNMFSGHSSTVQGAQTVTPNILQGEPPMHYPVLRPMQASTSLPYTPYHHRAAHAGQSVSSISSDMAMTMSGMSTNTSLSDEDEPMAPAPSYDSEFLSSPCSGTDEEPLIDTPDRARARLLLEPPSPSDAEAKDRYLLHAKASGLSYREIKLKGNFKEAESTLRGRYRTITKAKQERVRKPVWKNEDIILLRRGVEFYAEITTKTRTRQPLLSSTATTTAAATATITAPPTATPVSTTETYQEMKVPWKKVSSFIVEHGGSYRFGNATCKKKWFEIVNAGLVSSAPIAPVAPAAPQIKQEMQA